MKSLFSRVIKIYQRKRLERYQNSMTAKKNLEGLNLGQGKDAILRQIKKSKGMLEEVFILFEKCSLRKCS